MNSLYNKPMNEITGVSSQKVLELDEFDKNTLTVKILDCWYTSDSLPNSSYMHKKRLHYIIFHLNL